MSRRYKNKKIVGKRPTSNGMVIDYKRSVLTSVRFRGETFDGMGIHGTSCTIGGDRCYKSEARRRVLTRVISAITHDCHLRPIVAWPFAEPLRVDTRSSMRTRSKVSI